MYVLSNIVGYKCADIYCRGIYSHGGVAIYLQSNVNFKKIDVEYFCIEKDFEVVAVILTDLNIILVSIYRSPHSNTNTFLNLIEKLLIVLSVYNTSIIVCGDINIDINLNNELVNQFLNILRSVNCFCINKEPTRGNACLDNVITNLPQNSIRTQVVSLPLSDH